MTEQTTLRGADFFAALRAADGRVGLVGTDHAYALRSLAEVIATSLGCGIPVEVTGLGEFRLASNSTIKFTPERSLKARLGVL